MEHHRILMPTAEPRPHTVDYPDAMADMAAEARAWAEGQGLAIISLGHYAQTRMKGQEAAVGVTFDVVVGKGGRGDDWTWSARALWWKGVLAALPTPYRPKTANTSTGTAKIIPLDRSAQTARERLGLPDVGVSGVKRETRVERQERVVLENVADEETGVKIKRGGIRFPGVTDEALAEPDHAASAEDRSRYLAAGQPDCPKVDGRIMPHTHSDGHPCRGL